MTPDPTLTQDLSDEDSRWSDVAASVAFGGQSSDAETQTPQTDNGSFAMLLAFIGVIIAIGYLRSWWFPGLMAGLMFMLFMHEFGHYLTARASGMKVTEFFLGFGPKIWSFNKGETEYGVKAIPAGAYVRIMGMTNLDDIDPAEEHRTYRSQPYWQRMMTICAGSAMHFLMAIAALAALFIGYSYAGFNGPPWSVAVVVEGSTAERLGVQVGDRIVSINDDGFDNWDEFGDVVGNLDQGPVEIAIERDGERQLLQGTLGVRPEDVMLDGFGLNLLVEDPAIGGQAAFVWPEDPADRFGIERRDIIVRAGGIESPSENALGALLQANEGQTITIDVLRDARVVWLPGTAQAGEPVDAQLARFGVEADDRVLRVGSTVEPGVGAMQQAFDDNDGEIVRVQVLRGGDEISLTGEVELNDSTPFRGFFGVGPTFDEEPDRGTAGSFGAAFGDFVTISETNIVGIAELVNPLNWGDEEPEVQRRAAQRQATVTAPVVVDESCDGPDTNRPLSLVGIGRLFSCSDSADQVLFLFAIVNIFIGIFNLVPLLPLDGGHAAIATYERGRGLITGKQHRVDAAKLVPVTWLVIIGLVALGLWTVTLDIFAW